MSEQLFNTEHLAPADEPVRHLRSVLTDRSATDRELAARSTQWRLDDKTIQAGREGIAKAREALRDSRKSDKSDRADRLAA